MLKIIPILIIIIFVVMFISFKTTNQKPEEVINKVENSTIKKVLVDTSEDNKALGFSGQKKLVSDSKGNIFVAYRKKTNNYYEIFVAKLKKDGNSSHQVVFKKNVSNISNKANQRVPSIAIDSKDNLHVVWYGADSNNTDGDREIKYSNSKDGGNSWSKAINISFVEGFGGEILWQEHPDILVGKDDSLFVVWEGKDKESSIQLIKFSKSKDGSNWTKWKDIKVAPNSESRPTIIQDKSGIIYVFMYSKNDLNNSQIWYSISQDSGENWSDWKNISNSSGDSRHLSATLDSQNNIHLVWRELNQSSGKTQIAYSKFNGTIWSKSEIISQSNTFQFFPHIGINLDDTLFISWLETANKSDFPGDDPAEGNSYLVLKKVNDSSFSKKLLIDSDSFFPNVISDSRSKSSFILYSTKEAELLIMFGVIDP